MSIKSGGRQLIPQALLTRFQRVAQLSTPIVGTATLRACQLLVLIALARLATEDERDVLITAFGLLASVGIVSDSGAGNFLLTSDPASISKSVFRRVLAVHLSTTMTGSLVVLAAVTALGPQTLSNSGIAVIVALSVAQVVDSTIRVVKAPLLIYGRDGMYGTVDVFAAATKVPIIALAFVLDDMRVLCALPFASIGLGLWLLTRVWPQVPAASGLATPRLIQRILEIGASGALTALYSQAPLFIGSATLSVSDAAKLAAATRIVQSLEFVPSTLATQAMPRLRRDRTRTARWWGFLVIFGVTLGSLVVACRGAIERILTLDLGPTLMLALLCSAFAVKCGNYILVAALLSRSMARKRLAISIGVGCVAIALCAIASQSGLSAFATAALTTEMVLAGSCATALSYRRAR